MIGYPYDHDHLRRTAALLYQRLPAHLKTRDLNAVAGRMNLAEPPTQDEELRLFIELMAAPLAAIRQSIEELHADLFIETASDDVLPLLAGGIGLRLLRSDPEANRRDIADTMFWRRRKGTLSMLERLARAQTARLVASNEGWRLVQISQDLNRLRLERTSLDLRRPSVADRVVGPMESLARSVDPRPIGKRSGRVHPRHIAHWTHLSTFFPLADASPHRLPDGADDLRFAFDAENAWRALRLRATGAEDDLRTDRVPEQIFAENPDAWFNRDGRFSVTIAGLPAAAARENAPRIADRIPASASLYSTTPSIALIDYDGARTSGPVAIDLMAAPLTGALPDAAAAVLRRSITVDRNGVAATSGPAGPAPTDALPMLRISPVGSASSRFFAGAVIVVAGGLIRSRRASANPSRAREGYTDGALYLRIPAQRVTGDAWFYIGDDGGLHAASETDGVAVDLPLDTDDLLPPRAAVSQPIGPVWPPARARADRRPFSPPACAPAAPPVVMHGGRTLRPSGASPLPAGQRCALVFALTYFDSARRFEPFLRLAWSGDDIENANWSALESDGAPAPNPLARWDMLAATLNNGRADLALALRFECETVDAFLEPAEIAFTAFNGQSVLIHAPQFKASSTSANASWPLGPGPLAAHGDAVHVGRDGSTWTAGANILRRQSLGGAAPVRDSIPMLRRRPRWRRLCAWQKESGPNVLDPTPPGHIDIDPRFGLFAIASSEPPQSFPPGPGAAPHPVRVDRQVGATSAIGALPLDFDRALNRSASSPTRIVSATTRLAAGADPSLFSTPVYQTVADALTDIAVAPNPLEIIEIHDSSFYESETLTWPTGPDQLIIRAANGVRPVIDVAAAPAGGAYDRFELTGVLLTAAASLEINLPSAGRIDLNYVTTRRNVEIRVRFFEGPDTEQLIIYRSIIGGVLSDDPGLIYIADTIIDAGIDGARDAIAMPLGQLTMDAVTTLGTVRVERIDASDCLLRHPVFANERFAGCIRYSWLAPGGETPRKHRVIRTPPPRFASLDAFDPAYLRLAEESDTLISTGASDGGEVGAFHHARISETLSALKIRLAEHTPAGATGGVIVQP